MLSRACFEHTLNMEKHEQQQREHHRIELNSRPAPPHPLLTPPPPASTFHNRRSLVLCPTTQSIKAPYPQQLPQCSMHSTKIRPKECTAEIMCPDKIFLGHANPAVPRHLAEGIGKGFGHPTPKELPYRLPGRARAIAAPSPGKFL